MPGKNESQCHAKECGTSKSTWFQPTLKQFGPVQGLTLGSGGSNGDGQLGKTRGGMMWNNGGMGNGNMMGN